jgi:hypothetical protein
MELKDVILSTLAEMEEEPRKVPQKIEPQEMHPPKEKQEVFPIAETKKAPLAEKTEALSHDSELIYLSSIKERLLVLFEGFQAPNNTNIEAKVDMTLNFLEYTLATIDARIELLEKGKK